MGQAKERQLSGRKKVIGTLGSTEPKVENERTNIKLAELAKNNQNGSFKGNRFKKVVSGSSDPDTTKETNAKLAELAKTRLFHHGLFFFSSPARETDGTI